MGLYLRITGDGSELHDRARNLMKEKYEPALGLHEVDLAYTSGLGYLVTQAVRKPVAVGMGDVFPDPGPDEDIRGEVVALLQRAGLPVRT